MCNLGNHATPSYLGLLSILNQLMSSVHFSQWVFNLSHLGRNARPAMERVQAREAHLYHLRETVWRNLAGTDIH